MEFSQTTKRICNKLAIRIQDGNEDVQASVVEIIKIHGSEIGELFVYQSYGSIEFFLTIMKHLPKLKHLIVVDTSMNTSNETVEFPELKVLKTIQLVSLSSFDLFKLIECLKKSHLEIIQIRDCDFEAELLKDLLHSQKHLKTLSLRCGRACSQIGDRIGGAMLKILDETLPFTLTNLSLRFQEGSRFEMLTNLTKFMETQSQTIKSLESRGRFPNGYYEKILSKFSNLKSLRISISDLPWDSRFYVQLQAKNVTTLFLVDMESFLYHSCPPYFQNFIRCLPNITDLTVDSYYCQESMRFLSNNLKLVEKLSIRDVVKYNKYHAVQFPKLHTLNIKMLALDSSWYEFVKDNTQLRDLTVNKITIKTDFTLQPIDQIKKFIDSVEPLKLQKFSIGKRYPSIPIIQSTKSIFEKLPFRDENLFNHWFGHEFWTDEKCFGSLVDKWHHDGRHSYYDIEYTFYNRCNNVPGSDENILAILEKDLKENEKMAVKMVDHWVPYPRNISARSDEKE